MSAPATYNIEDQYRGDTIDFNAEKFRVVINAEPLDLTPIEICLQIRGSNRRTVYDAIKPANATTGNGINLDIDPTYFIIADINPPEVDALQVDFYKFDIQLKFTDGQLKTYIKGSFRVLPDITRK